MTTWNQLFLSRSPSRYGRSRTVDIRAFVCFQPDEELEGQELFGRAGWKNKGRRRGSFGTPPPFHYSAFGCVTVSARASADQAYHGGLGLPGISKGIPSATHGGLGLPGMSNGIPFLVPTFIAAPPFYFLLPPQKQGHVLRRAKA